MPNRKRRNVITVQRDTVEIPRPRDLRRHLHAATNERLSEHVFDGFVVLLVVSQLFYHRYGVLQDEQTC